MINRSSFKIASILLVALSVAACNNAGSPPPPDDQHEEGGHGHDEHGDEGDHHDDHGDEGEHHDEEARTRIPDDVAAESGIEVAAAGPASIGETVELSGTVRLRPSAMADVRAAYPGPVLRVTKTVGDEVRRGDVLAEVENSNSLQTYLVRAPISGTVLERFSNPGDVAGGEPLIRLADLTALQAELHVFPKDAARISTGQPVTIRLAGGDIVAGGKIASFLPLSETGTQSLIARVDLPPANGFRPGMRVLGDVETSSYEVPLAILETGLQRFRDDMVVFVKEGETYEARPVQTGRSDGTYLEVLSGLEPGETYVTSNSYLIKADIEKAGAGHSH
jgi:cobalt-zinc-cadmium efflux system membrane fusion protein